MSALENSFNDTYVDSDNSKIADDILCSMKKTNDKLSTVLLNQMETRMKSLFIQHADSMKVSVTKNLDKSDKPLFNEDKILLKISEIDEKLSSDLITMENRLKCDIGELILDKCESDLAKSTYPSLSSLSESSLLDISTHTNISSLTKDSEMSSENTSDFMTSSVKTCEFSENNCIYIATSDLNFDKKNLDSFVTSKFGTVEFLSETLTTNVNSTYKSFKLCVSDKDIEMCLNLRNWPSSFYVRRFESRKKSISTWLCGSFGEGRREIRKNFVYNPLRYIV